MQTKFVLINVLLAAASSPRGRHGDDRPAQKYYPRYAHRCHQPLHAAAPVLQGVKQMPRTSGGGGSVGVVGNITFDGGGVGNNTFESVHHLGPELDAERRAVRQLHR
jgi:hypothetical protein